MKFDYQIYKQFKTTKALKMFPSIRLYIKYKKKVENGKVLLKDLEALVKTTKKLIVFKAQIPPLNYLFIRIKYQYLFPRGLLDCS